MEILWCSTKHRTRITCVNLWNWNHGTKLITCTLWWSMIHSSSQFLKKTCVILSLCSTAKTPSIIIVLSLTLQVSLRDSSSSHLIFISPHACLWSCQILNQNCLFFLLTISYYYSCTPVHAASSLPLRNIINCVCMNRCCVFNAVSLLSWCWYLCFCFMTVLLCTERYFGCDETLFCSPLTSGLQYSFCNLYNFSLPLDSPQPLSIWWLWSLSSKTQRHDTKFSCSFYLNLCGCWLNGNKILCSYYYEVLFDVAIPDVYPSVMFWFSEKCHRNFI